MRLIAEQVSGARGGMELFSGLSCVLHRGEGLVITGHNGAGKSTFLRILAGLLAPSAGTVRFEKEDRTFAQDAFHFLGSLNAMKDQLTASENLAFWQQFLGSAALAPLQALEAVKLSHVADLPYGYLSTGQKRRVAIARLLCIHRPVWLVDEPTSGLDKASEQLFASLAQNYLNAGGILVAATHVPLGVADLQNLTIGEPS
jgi:heme exporter protein A